jgi:hypothetical protein
LTISFESVDGYQSVPFTFPITIVPAVAPETEFQSRRPLFGRVSAIRWYDQYYWPFALDQSAAGQSAGYYDLLLVDRDRDGDMADEGERVRGQWSPGKKLLTFNVGDLHFVDGKREDPRFQVGGMVVTIQANADPVVQFRTTIHHRMFSELEYTLLGPYGSEMKFSADITKMPTLNLTPEIVAAPEFKGKQIQLFIKDENRQFKIGEVRQLSLVCLTGDQEKNDFVFALKNASFKKPVLATLIYTNQKGETRGREFELEDWSGELTFAGSVSIPADAIPGRATLIANFSERDEGGRSSRNWTHFTQLVRGGTSYINQSGEEKTAEGWELEIELIK